MTRSLRRCTALRSGTPSLTSSCGSMKDSSDSAEPPFFFSSAISASIWAESFSSDMPIGPMRRPWRNCWTTGSSEVSRTSRGPNITRFLRNSIPMLSGSERAVPRWWVTMRIVASSWALRSTISWLRYAVRTGSRPESGSSTRMISGSSTRARARPARFFMPPEISPGSLSSAPPSPTRSSFSMTMSLISDSPLRVCSRSGKAMLSKRFIDPNSAPSWNSTPNSLRIS